MKNNDKPEAVRYNEKIPGPFASNIRRKESLDQKQERRTGI